jgi:hypothetical protein
MNPNINSAIPTANRIGFHYFPDMLHYTNKDLQTWLPELHALNASWLVLHADADRAIPESFLNEIIGAHITPILHHHLSLDNPIKADSFQPILDAYAHWGAEHIIFFDRPNDRSSWNASNWVQQDLVERYLDRYLPLANAALDAGMKPILSPLEPGGSYWDTAFLRSTLESLSRRKQQKLIDNLIISAYAWTGGHSLNWGAGGPECWPDVHPYFTPAESQDERGFRIFDWYRAIHQAVLHQPARIILLNAGLPVSPSRLSAYGPGHEADSEACLAEASLSIARLLNGETIPDPSEPEKSLKAVPDDVMAAAFCFLPTGSTAQPELAAWYSSDGSALPTAKSFKSWVAANQASKPTDEHSAPANGHLLKHYLLLPSYDWGVANWHMEVIRPFVNRHRPTVGFSVDEASLADRVTVIGNQDAFSDESLARLRQKGCTVERIEGNGISIATQLAER